MFDSARLLGTPRDLTYHPLHTRKNTPIEAFRGADPSNQCPQLYQAFKDLHPQAIERRGVIGGYNCAGLVWSSRRAVIPNPKDWELLLVEDGYRQIADGDAEIGDVVVYRDAEPPKEILHVGRICRMDALLVPGAAGQNRGVFMVLSKLNSTFGELIHRKDDIHFFGKNARFTSHVFTDR